MLLELEGGRLGKLQKMELSAFGDRFFPFQILSDCHRKASLGKLLWKLVLSYLLPAASHTRWALLYNKILVLGGEKPCDSEAICVEKTDCGK